METQVRTPQSVFMQPQRLVVPLFQRPYVWTQESQWEPLWEDITRVAERMLNEPGTRPPPHFLGAVVLQQVQTPIGRMHARTIIDGQQRLTTLQLVLDALHAELIAVNAVQPATRIEALVMNPPAFCTAGEERFKVWPTNRDRPAFNAVMAAEPPLDYNVIGHNGAKIPDAHRFFSMEAREWLSAEGPERVQTRAEAIETVVRDLLQMVVIELAADENAQEIFETLNARGTPLTAADLIKNFVFQKLIETDIDVEATYSELWREFETGFWETEVSVGRLRYPRSSIFLNHWLVARTGKEVPAREVFSRFKHYADYEASAPMMTVLRRIHAASHTYRSFVSSSETLVGSIDELGLFGYRTGVLESEVIKPLILCLYDPDRAPIEPAQIRKALAALESWMVRRMLVRATTKNYNQVVAEIIAELNAGQRIHAGDYIERRLKSETADSRYWPDDAEVRAELEALPAYRRLRRGRLRMLLESIEDHLRGWRDGQSGLGGERVARSKLHIEHVMPRKWQGTWPMDPSNGGEAERDQRLHTLGNLTLLTGKLNSRVSNGPWLGAGGKKEALEKHDVLLMNRELVKAAGNSWSDSQIVQRTQTMIDAILSIWPAPPGHRSGFARSRPAVRRWIRIQVSDLINGGALETGTVLTPRRKKYFGRTATLLADGSIEVDGTVYASPTEAASAIAGRRTGGWAFFYVDPATKKTLRQVRSDYITTMSTDDDDEDRTEDDEDDEVEADV